MNSQSRPILRRAALLAVALLGAGFCVGYGYGAGRRTVVSDPTPPAIKGMRVSLDGKLLGFTATYDNARLASRFILDLGTKRYDAREAPSGWQDYVSGWTRDGKVLLEREKIPRPADDAEAGFYEEEVSATSKGIAPQEPSLLSGESLNAQDKVIGGFLDPDDRLVVRTHREPKGAFALRDGEPELLARTDAQFYQLRAVRENGSVAYYVVRDMPGPTKQAALFRIQGGVTRRLGPAWDAPSWVYLREDGRQLVVCHKLEGEDAGWNWTLSEVTARSVTERKSAKIPADVIAVYWSPDGKALLGTGGDDVWIVDAAKLQARKLPRRPGNVTWNADNAAWLNNNTVLIAVDGVLWRISTQGKSAPELVWSVPAKYWK